MLTALTITAFVFKHLDQTMRVAVSKHDTYKNNAPQVLARSGGHVDFAFEYEGKSHQIRGDAVLSLSLSDQPGGVFTTMEQLNIYIPSAIPKDVLDFKDVEVSCSFTREGPPEKPKKQGKRS